MEEQQADSSQFDASIDPQKALRIAGVILFFAALLLRLLGIGWGLPDARRAFSMHPDETPNLAYSRGIEPAKLDFAPSFYNYGTLYFTLLRIGGDMALTYAGDKSPEAELLSGQNARVIHLAGRIMNAVFGAASAVLVLLLSARLFALPAAIVSAGIMAVAPGLVVHSRFQTVDMLSVLCVAVGLYAGVRLAEKESAIGKWTLIGALAAGLGAGTKYTGVLVIFSILVALAIRDRTQLVKWALLTIGVTVLAFIVSTPGCLLETEKFLTDLKFEMDHSKSGHGIVFAATAPAALYHIGNLITASGLLTLLIGGIGLIEGARRKAPWFWIIAAFTIAYYVVIARAEIKFLRYTLPLLVPISIACGAAIHQIALQDRFRKGAWLLAAFLIGGVDRGNLASSLALTTIMMGEDARDRALLELKAVNARTVGIVADPWFWTPMLYPEVPAPRFVGPEKIQAWRLQVVAPAVVQYIPAVLGERFDWDARLVTELRPEYITFTSLQSAPVERILENGTNNKVEQLFANRYKEFLAALSDRYTLFRDIDPWPAPLVEDMEYIRPRVWIWKRKEK